MSPLQEFHILNRAFPANPFLWGVWAVFQGVWNARQTVWKPWASDCSSLSCAHASFSCFAFPCLLGCEWIRKFLWSICFLSIFLWSICFPVNIWFFLLNNMGYETNPANIKKRIPSGTRPGNSAPTQIHWTLLPVFLLTCVCSAWSGPCAWGSRVMMLAMGCLGLLAGTTASVLYPYPRKPLPDQTTSFPAEVKRSNFLPLSLIMLLFLPPILVPTWHLAEELHT